MSGKSTNKLDLSMICGFHDKGREIRKGILRINMADNDCELDNWESQADSGVIRQKLLKVQCIGH